MKRYGFIIVMLLNVFICASSVAFHQVCSGAPVEYFDLCDQDDVVPQEKIFIPVSFGHFHSFLSKKQISEKTFVKIIFHPPAQ